MSEVADLDAAEREQFRARQAERLLKDPLLVEAFETVEKSYLDAWQNSAEAQERDRERLWIMTMLLRRVRMHLAAAMEGGKIAGKRLAEIRERKRFF